MSQTNNNFLMKPKVDFAFKEIMANEKARIGFLSAILKIAPSEIKETRILNTNLRKVHENDKLGILDVRILMNDNTEIDTEIQLAELKIWADRALFYISKMYTEQIESGERYDVLKKCVSISILDFELFKDEKEYYSCFHIREDKRNIIFTDKVEFHVIELPKLPELPEEITEGKYEDILLWSKFINAEQREDFEMLASKSPYIESAYQQLQIISQDKEKRLEYEARQKAILDYNQSMYEAEQRGREVGEKIGREATAKNLLSLGISIETIATATNLTINEIEALQSKK